MIAIAQGLPGFKGETDSAFWAWCYQIARNKFNDYYRKTGREPINFIDPTNLILVPAEFKKEDDEIDTDKIDPAEILKLLEEFDPVARSIAYDHYILGIAWVDLAGTYGKSADALRKQVVRALESIQDEVFKLYGKEH